MDLEFRAIEKEDLPQLRDWRNKNHMRHRMREWRLLNMVNQQDWLERVSRSNTDRMFGITVRGNLIGVCGLCHINWKDRHAEISLYIGNPEYRNPEMWGQVLDKLRQIAFREYGLHRLWAEVYAFFTFGITALTQAGYEEEGKLRDTVWHDGLWWSSFIYGLLATERRKA